MMEIYYQIGLKLVVGFIGMVIYLNISGRTQLSPNSAADQIGNYVLGGIIGGALYNQDVSALEMVVVIILWGGLMMVMQILKYRNHKLKSLIDGNSILLYHQGQILSENLLIAKLSIRDFIANLHMRGIHRLDDLDSVWLETNNQYTILKKGETAFAYALIENGLMVEEQLALIAKDESWLLQQIKANGYDNLKDIIYAEAYYQDDQLKLRIYPNTIN